MSLYITSLNSGSNGNCYYIGNDAEAILVDAGISCRETETRMKRLGLSMDKVKAIFVSHEHTDHISGIKVLSKKFQLPVYITKGTQAYGRVHVEKHLVFRFKPNIPIQIGGLSITAFPKFHDAKDPHSFVVTSSSVTVGIFTDIGTPCDKLIRHFKSCHAAFLEANYDDEMLTNGGYPYYLKKRISGETGHLSNAQALALVLKHKPAFMSHLILSHLSKNNNCPKLVEDLFNKHIKDTTIIIAPRYNETPLFQISSADEPIRKARVLRLPSIKTQLSLFD
jgi:phosphoribosyl 1,2-cyclic phosphodiesterase